MKSLLGALLAIPVAFVVKGLSLCLTRLAAILASKPAARREEWRMLDQTRAPETAEEARALLQSGLPQAVCDYRRKTILYRSLLIAGLIDGVLALLGIMMQDPVIWIPLGLMMLMMTFIEGMILRSGVTVNSFAFALKISIGANSKPLANISSTIRISR